MAESQTWDVLIIGAGIAGLSTAIWARRLGLTVAVLERQGLAGGQLPAIHLPIRDYPGAGAATGVELAGLLYRQALEAGAAILLEQPVSAVDAGGKRCQTAAGPVCGRTLVLATGLSPRRLGVPGEEEVYRGGFVRRPSADLAWFVQKRVAVIGGGDRAAENALLIAAQAARVHLIHRGERLRARSEFQRELGTNDRVDLRLSTQVSGFKVTGETVQVELAQGAALTVDAVCIYIGNKPNAELVQGQVEVSPDGYLVIDGNGQTSVPGVYGVGDVAAPPEYQSLIAAAGQAMIVAKHIALNHGPS